jgi:predicted nucleic acid-binding protein
MPDAWDTSVASRALGEGRHAPLLHAHIVRGSTIVLPAPAVMEIARGAHLHSPRDRRFGHRLRALTTLLAHPRVRVLAFDGDAALLAGGLFATLPHPPTGSRRRRGTRAQQRASWALDVQIAACAFAAGFGILTENVADFALLRDTLAAMLPDVAPLVVSDAREPAAAEA